MIMGNVFQKKNQTLIYDQILSRDKKSEEGLQKYPEDIIHSMSRNFRTEYTQVFRKQRSRLFMALGSKKRYLSSSLPIQV